MRKGEINFTGRTYNIAHDCIIVVLTLPNEIQYYVKHPENDATILFSFSEMIDKKMPIEKQYFSRMDLVRLYRSGYFDMWIKDLEEMI